jgi:hypothetical protein
VVLGFRCRNLRCEVPRALACSCPALVPLCDEIEDRGHIQTAVLEQVNSILTARLGAVISAPRGEEGTVLAASIRDDLLAIGPA